MKSEDKLQLLVLSLVIPTINISVYTFPDIHRYMNIYIHRYIYTHLLYENRLYSAFLSQNYIANIFPRHYTFLHVRILRCDSIPTGILQLRPVSVFHFTLQKYIQSQKNQQALHISLKTLWAMEKSCIAHHPASTLKHPTWQLHSLCSLTLLFPQHSLSKTTTSPSGLLVYATQQNNSKGAFLKDGPGKLI